jgi:AP-1 complex subunit mu
MPELRLGLNDKVMFESTGRSKLFFPLSFFLSLFNLSITFFLLRRKIASRGKAIEMEDVKFHQCVRLSRFENDRTISFIPPDGEFELMSYRLNTQVKPLIWAEAMIEQHSGSRIEYVVKVSRQLSQLDRQKHRAESRIALTPV